MSTTREQTSMYGSDLYDQAKQADFDLAKAEFLAELERVDGPALTVTELVMLALVVALALAIVGGWFFS